MDDKLMLNDDKEEFLVIGTSKQLSKVSISSIRVGEVDVAPVPSARVESGLLPSIHFVMCKPLVFPFFLLISPTHHLLCSKPILRTFVVHWFSLESNPGNLSAILRQVPRRPEADFRVGELTCERAWYCWFASDVTAAMLVVKNKSISLRWEMSSILMQI